MRIFNLQPFSGHIRACLEDAIKVAKATEAVDDKIIFQFTFNDTAIWLSTNMSVDWHIEAWNFQREKEQSQSSMSRA